MKKNKLLILPVLLGSLVVTGCDKGLSSSTDTSSTTTIIDANVYKKTTYLAIPTVNFDLDNGTTRQIEARTIPNNNVTTDLVYVSEDTSIATVSETGLVTGVKPGHTHVTVSTKDGSISYPINVYVKDIDVKPSDLQTIASNISSGYGTGYVAPKKARSFEYDCETYAKDGVVQRGYECMEEICYDAEQGYFMITSDDLKVKTASGAEVPQSGKWIFYVVNDNEARLFHITKSAKTYCPAFSMGDYDGPNYKAQIIRDILDFFFVSGAGIVDNLLNDVAGMEDFNQIKGEVSTSPAKFASFGGNSITTTDEGSWDNQTISNYAEFSVGEIPAGTKATIGQSLTYYFKENVSTGYDVTVTYDYVLNETENWNKTLLMNKEFMTDFTPEKYSKPDENGFKKVSSIFDL